MSDWTPTVVLKENTTVQDIYHSVERDGQTTCGRRVPVEANVRWRWRAEGLPHLRPCVRCFIEGQS